ncbi:MAG TPA: beta-ketoacyl synthase N-terminal-like domain-containing protein, partial [Thermoanaerobaculia bacterium]|nr:beta-ketoacyl synthase N-terminal-like domain-containing protein [Thermoanaerobaculia bacterium]
MRAIDAILASGFEQVAAIKAGERALAELGVIAQQDDGLTLLEDYAAASIAIPDNALPKFRGIIDALRFAQKRGDVDDLRRRLRAHPELDAHVKLVDACIAALPRVVRGEIAATEVLFPNGSMELVEAVHRGSPEVIELNRRVASAVRERVNARRGLRILEIGAGTGGTTVAVLDALAGTDAEFCFTDVSPHFVKRAEQTFRGRLANMRFAALDIERDPAAQGFEAGTFDVIIAANVLHATRRIDESLGNVKRLLRAGGTLLLNEATRFHAFATVTFGLLDGWWRFDDGDVRIPHTPLLTADAWRDALTRAGFRDFATLSEGDVGQSVLTATLDSAHDVVAIVAEVLGVDVSEIDPSLPLVDIGADAVATRAIAARLGRSARDLANLPRLSALWSVSAPARAQRAIETNGEPGGATDTIRRLVAAALEIDPSEVDPSLPFSDYGIDSIMAVDVAAHISEAVGVQLRPTDLFNYPTIRRLAEHLGTHITPIEPSETRVAAAEMGDVFDMLRPQEEIADGIAVIGMSGRFPGAPDVAAFWQRLADGTDCVTEMPLARFGAGAEGKWGGFLDRVDDFDPLFFNISPREAVQMDPQQRLFLEEAWRTFEDAGYPPAELDGKRCGVFVGGGSGDYQRRLDAAGLAPEAFTFMGNAGSILAARIAFVLNLKGPSIAIDTACSSSLSAIHLACESLRHGACDLALAGGVAVLSTTSFHDSATRAGMLSPHGRCKTFDRAADGFVPAEGVGAVLLKRVADAVADGDRIYAVVRASATNQDGRTNGITAPSGPSQTALEQEVYERCGISPESLTLIEAHGTGTKLGDPIEVDALTDAFHRWTERRNFCALTSVKANIGHTLAAAGVASFIKVLLCLDREAIPPSVHFSEANEHLKLDASPFFVPRALTPWKSSRTPRRAAISSFGFSGTNVHLVIEDVPPSFRRARNGRVAPLPAATFARERFAPEDPQWHRAPAKAQPHAFGLHPEAVDAQHFVS